MRSDGCQPPALARRWVGQGHGFPFVCLFVCGRHHLEAAARAVCQQAAAAALRPCMPCISHCCSHTMPWRCASGQVWGCCSPTLHLLPHRSRRHTTASASVQKAHDAAFRALNEAYQALMEGEARACMGPTRALSTGRHLGLGSTVRAGSMDWTGQQFGLASSLGWPAARAVQDGLGGGAGQPVGPPMPPPHLCLPSCRRQAVSPTLGQAPRLQARPDGHPPSMSRRRHLPPAAAHCRWPWRLWPRGRLLRRRWRRAARHVPRPFCLQLWRERGQGLLGLPQFRPAGRPG